MKNKSEKTQQEPTTQQFTGRKFRIQFDFNYEPAKGELNTMPSKAVPDMSLTVRQLLENHTRGHNNEVVAKEPIYFETEIPTITDLTDIQLYREGLQRRLKEVEETIQKEKEEREQALKDLEVNPDTGQTSIPTDQ